ncbi:hypothetical protein N0V84_000751 [Fusarium piperis]|uniref:Uncharacterized protein n=1 Tax=Fusarium piperis TaxID=1435070 RepID=A0A9W8WMC6_9HYPO|nr:hypothetical protein N0V84_000751 [Fusarium piperis]
MYLLKKLNGEKDPTWGFYFLVNGAELAAQKLVEIVRRVFAANAHPALAAEACKRFKMDLVQDREALDGASDDRVREEFNAFLRGHGLWPASCSDSGPFMPARLFVCFVLDEATILELESLSFPEKVGEDYKALENVRIKIIDRPWQRPKSGWSSYLGVDYCPVYGLMGVYHMTGDGDSDSMKDMYPESRCFY